MCLRCFTKWGYVSDSCSYIIMAEDLKVESIYNKIFGWKRKKENNNNNNNNNNNKKRERKANLVCHSYHNVRIGPGLEKKYLIKLVSFAMILC